MRTATQNERVTMSERTALRFTAGIALIITFVATVSFLAMAAHALNVAGFTTPRVAPEKAYDGPPLK